MPANRKPKAWNLKPQLTQAPDLWRDCAFFIAYWGGDVVDLVTGTRASDQSNVALTTTPYGAGADHSGRVQFSSLQPMAPGPKGATFLSYANPPATGRYSAICQRIGNFDEQIEMRFGADTLEQALDAAILMRVGNGGIELAADGSARNVLDGNWHVFIGEYPAGNSNRACKIYVDGIDKTDDTRAGNPSFGPSGTFVLGGLPGTTAISYQNEKLLDIGWNRELSVGEKRLLGNDPFAMLRPAGF